jgi:hypothetical protein
MAGSLFAQVCQLTMKINQGGGAGGEPNGG